MTADDVRLAALFLASIAVFVFLWQTGVTGEW